MEKPKASPRHPFGGTANSSIGIKKPIQTVSGFQRYAPTVIAVAVVVALAVVLGSALIAAGVPF